MHNNLFSRPLIIIALIFALWAIYLSNYLLNLGPGWLAGIAVAAFLIFYISSGWCLHMFSRWIRHFNHLVDDTSIEIIFGGTAGLLFGVLLGALSTYPLSMINGVGTYITMVNFLLCGYLGLKIGSRKAFDVWGLFPGGDENEPDNGREEIAPKVLDTSAIIDGRIYDVCLSNFLDGKLLVPLFVIEELQHIADSSDSIRRNKGRRGLDLLSKMTKHSNIKIAIIEENIPEENEVDLKLIRLCKKTGAHIITNDYNLNKVAELQGIRVLNINELSNAVKIIVYPGETMYISVIKQGKEEGQGVGYLEDGTMVVVEDAQHELGNNLEVMVTSVFQTAAGRMIFTRKIKEDSNEVEHHHIKDIEMQEVNLYG